MSEHLLDGVLAHAGSFLGLAVLAAAFGRPRADAVGRRLSLAAAVLLGGASLLHLASATLAFAGALEPTAVARILGRTTFGRSFGVFVAGAGAAWLLRRRPVPAWTATGVALLGFVWLGHGATLGDLSLRALLTFVHVAALLGWVSGLLSVVAEVASGLRPAGALRAFSRRALPLVAVAVASGLLLSASYVGGELAAGAAWLVALGSKGLVVGGALALAWRNRRALAILDPEEGWPGLERGLEREVFLVFTAIGLAALLSQLPPP